MADACVLVLHDLCVDMGIHRHGVPKANALHRHRRAADAQCRSHSSTGMASAAYARGWSKGEVVVVAAAVATAADDTAQGAVVSNPSGLGSTA
eukprot:COSAG01_NODE_497_length_16267_cov_5.357558_6_plen_93_part_00